MSFPDFKHDPTELIVLAVLSESSLYGYAITKQVAARSDGEIKLSPGVLYPLLSKMERQGLIASSWEVIRSDRAANVGEGHESGDADSGGRRRKWYRVSAKGKRRLAQHAEAHRAYAALINSFLSPARGGDEA